MEDIAISTFHMGFLLTSVFCCASIHLMIVIGEPDLTEEKDKVAWRGYVRFLQFMMFLPLTAYFLSHFQDEPEAPFWFLGTTLITALLFVPTALALKTTKQPPAEGVKPAESEDRQLIQRKVRTHMRILLGNFSLGLVMGAAILFPFLVTMGSILILFKGGVITAPTRDALLKLTPAFCSLMIPVLMPFMFLAFGPLVLKTTQGARSLHADKKWNARWEALVTRSQNLGFTTLIKTRLFELPWQDLGAKNAFYLGLPSRLNPFNRGIFIIKGLDDVLDTNEVDFVIAHEAAHGLNGHPVRRVVLGVGIFVFFLCSQVFALALHAVALSFAAAAICLLWGTHLLKRQAEMQEMEADVMAVKIQGGTSMAVQAAANALRKLDQFNLTKGPSRTHPRTDQRIAYLEAIFAEQIKAYADQTSQKAA